MHSESPQTVLLAMQVSRAMRDNVNGSVKIQKAIGLLPEWDADFTPLLWPSQMISSSVEREYDYWLHGLAYSDFFSTYCRAHDTRFDDFMLGIAPDPRTLTHAEFRLTTSSKHSLEKLGSRCRFLSPCQPPVKRMLAYYLCDHCNPWIGPRPPREIGRVSPGNGEHITLGDLHRANVEARERHRRKCRQPEASARFSIELDGMVPVREGGPIMLGRRDRVVASKTYSLFEVDWESGLEKHKGDHSDMRVEREEEGWARLEDI